jgi:hypothetical protein
LPTSSGTLDNGVDHEDIRLGTDDEDEDIDFWGGESPGGRQASRGVVDVNIIPEDENMHMSGDDEDFELDDDDDDDVEDDGEDDDIEEDDGMQLFGHR